MSEERARLCGALLGSDEVEVPAGGVLVKPRGRWHTFWNPDDRPARVLEIIVPAGLEQLFRLLDGFDGWPQPEELERIAARFGTRLDLAATTPLAERLDLDLEAGTAADHLRRGSGRSGITSRHRRA